MNRPPSQQNLMALSPGCIVRTSYRLFDHVGILSDRLVGGERSVISFSARAGGFSEEALSVFSAGQPVIVDGYLGALPPEVVMKRARQKRGQKYDLVGFNCEHFIRYAHGLPIESPQLQLWMLIGSTVAAAVFLARAKKA